MSSDSFKSWPLKLFDTCPIERWGHVPPPLESGLCDSLTNKINNASVQAPALQTWQLPLHVPGDPATMG